MARTIRVVVADDVEDVRVLVTMNLAMDARFEVVGEATDGDEAIAIVKSLQPDAIVLDLMMPTRTGIDAIPEILANAPDTKILVLTAHDERRRVNAMNIDALAYEFKGNDLMKRVTSGLVNLCAQEAL